MQQYRKELRECRKGEECKEPNFVALNNLKNQYHEKETTLFIGCAEYGSFVGAEIFGRCQHPIESGSGTGVFEGVSGRLDFKDDVASGTFPYRGHLRY